MNDVVFLSDSLSATVFSLITAIILFTLFAITGGILVRRAGWKMLPAIAAFLIIAIIRGLLPLEYTRAKIIHYPESVGNAFYALYEPRFFSLSILSIIGLLWLAGAVISFLIFLWKLIAQHREVKHISENASGELTELFCKACNDAKICRQGVLFVDEKVSSPMMVGFFQPIVLLPKQCENLNEEELRLIMRHELAHFRYHDLWKKLALKILCCAFWWNPAAYFLCRAATQTQELRADAFACSGADEDTRLHYAEALLDALKSRKGKENLVAAGYFNRSSDQYLKQRFQEILQFTQTKRKAALAWVAMVLALAICAGSYMVNFQPIDTPTDEGNYEDGDAAPNQFIINLGNGVFQLYSDGLLVATLNEEDVTSGNYDLLPIYSATADIGKGEP